MLLGLVRPRQRLKQRSSATSSDVAPVAGQEIAVAVGEEMANMWQRRIAAALAGVMLLGLSAQPAKKAQPTQFDILGASVTIEVQRDGVVLPASLVPKLERGDVLEISFPRGVQFSREPRWHLVVADMYDDYLRHAPSFPIADADLSRAPAGHVWRVSYDGRSTPLMFLVPEDGSRRGRGLPDARAAIGELGNRSLLLQTATLSAGAEVKASTMAEFLRSLASIQPGQLADGRARVAAATQSLFGYDLGNAACFAPDVAQSTQYACAAQAVAQGYDAQPKPNPVAAVASQLSVNAATYGMLIGALYQLLAKRRVAAHYIFVPGVIRPGAPNTDVYVGQRLSYDATAAKPSTIVYFGVGSKETSLRAPSYGPAPKLPICVAADTFDVAMPFDGLPVYFRSHHLLVTAGSRTFTLPASYDPLLGYGGELSTTQRAALADGGTVKVASAWGFSNLLSPPVALVEPHSARWALAGSPQIVSGSASATLTFTDGSANMGSCVASVDVHDALGRTLPVTAIERENNRIKVTLDASNALGPMGSAVVNESTEPSSAAIGFALLPPMPSVTSATAYLPRGTLVLRGTGLKYIATATLERTGVTFDDGTPNADGSWTFVAPSPAPYQAKWEHETMAISYTMQPPDKRTAATEANVQYAAAPAQPSPSPSPSPVPTG
jgi:hypothetical protein